MNNTFKIGDKQIPGYFTIDDFRRVKRDFAIDLGSMEASSISHKINVCPVAVCDVLYALLQPKLMSAGISSQQEMERLIGPDDFTGLQKGLIEQLAGFFPLVRMLSTSMSEAQAGMLKSQQQQPLRKMPDEYSLSGTSY